MSEPTFPDTPELAGQSTASGESIAAQPEWMDRQIAELQVENARLRLATDYRAENVRALAENERFKNALLSALDSLSVPSFADERASYIECQLDPEDYVALWRAAGKPLDALPEWLRTLAAAQPEPEGPTT